ncbi:MAG: hypothetical protein COA57_00665 [Flavobacteriales bacterium]|nr:MAG: hypothetical protein COA57_00665 [Flavobacteriales bacterium]
MTLQDDTVAVIQDTAAVFIDTVAADSVFIEEHSDTAKKSAHNIIADTVQKDTADSSFTPSHPVSNIQEQPEEVNIFIKKEEEITLDSTQQDTVEKDVLKTKNVEIKNLIQSQHVDDFREIAHQQTPIRPSWLIVILLLAFALIAWMKTTEQKRLKELLSAFFNNRFTGQILRRESVFTTRITAVLSTVFLLSLSMMLYQANVVFGWTIFAGTGIAAFAKILLGVFCFFLVKITAIQLTGMLLKNTEASTEYVFNIFLFNEVLGMVLLPVIICTALIGIASPTFIITGIIITAVTFLLRVFKIVSRRFATAKFSAYHIILYLCTFEILPLVVIFKVFV